MNKTIRFVFVASLFMMYLFFLQGCKTALSGPAKIKNDLVEHTLIFGDYSLAVESEEHIKKVKVISRETNKRERQDLVQIHVEAEDQYVLASGDFEVLYRYVIDEGWKIARVSPSSLHEQPQVELAKGIAENDVASSLDNVSIPIDIKSGPKNWRLSASNIQSIEILNSDVDKDALTDDLVLRLVAVNEHEKLQADLQMKYRLTNGWRFMSMDVLDYSWEIAYGITEEKVRDAIDGFRFSLPISLEQGVTHFEWVFNDAGLERLAILDQQISQNDVSNRLTGHLTSSYGNMRINGVFQFEFRYIGEGNWRLTNLTVDNPDELLHELIIPFDFTKEQLINTMEGSRFAYQSSWFSSQYWTIEAEDVRSLDIILVTPVRHGNSVEVYSKIQLTDEDASIEGEIKTIYDLIDDNWVLRSIARNGEFTITS